MAGNFLKALGAGLRIAGAAQSPENFQMFNQQNQFRQQSDDQKKQLMLGLLVKGVENGVIDEATFQQKASQLGFEGMPSVGASPQVRRMQAEQEAQQAASREVDVVSSTLNQARDRIFTGIEQDFSENPIPSAGLADGEVGVGAMAPTEAIEPRPIDSGGFEVVENYDPMENPDNWEAYANTADEIANSIRHSETARKNAQREADNARKTAERLRKEVKPVYMSGPDGSIIKISPDSKGAELIDILNKAEPDFLEYFNEQMSIGLGRGGANKFTQESVGKFVDSIVEGWNGGNKPTGGNPKLLRTDPRQTAAAGAGNVEKEEDKVHGKWRGEEFTRIMDTAREDESKARRYRGLQNLLDGVRTGRLTPLGTELARWAHAFGWDVDPNLGNKEAATAIGRELALELRNPSGGAGMPGALSDRDREFLVSMVPGLGTSPQGIWVMVDYREKLAKRSREVAKMAVEFRAANGGRFIAEDFPAVVAERFKDEHLFPAPKKKEEKIIEWDDYNG